MSDAIPAPGSAEEAATFAALQAELPGMYERLASDIDRSHAVVIVPSISLDPRQAGRILGVNHYEERLLFFLMLLRDPRTHVIFCTSESIDAGICDYFLNLLSGVPYTHARARLHLFSCDDASGTPLTEKLLARPRLLAKIRRTISMCDESDLVCFNSTPTERSLSVELGVPLHGNDPDLYDMGTKSGCREIFREANVPIPAGFERLRDVDDIAKALAELKAATPELERAVVKLNDGFSGEGNALFRYDGIDTASGSSLAAEIARRLPTGLEYATDAESWEGFSHEFRTGGGVVEEFIEGEMKLSPSMQGRVGVDGSVEAVSTHDQVLGGDTGQVFEGCLFPASPDYRLEIQELGMRVADVLAERGARGRFGVDFVTVPRGDRIEHNAIEINLRKGGTTHPFLTLRMLTNGTYDNDTGTFHTPTGVERVYVASDNLISPSYCSLGVGDLMEIALAHELHYDAAAQTGVVFHLMGALSEFGKLGYVAIGGDRGEAEAIAARLRLVLDAETKPGIDYNRPEHHGPRDLAPLL